MTRDRIAWLVLPLLAIAFCAGWLWPLDAGTDALDFWYFEFLFEAFRAEVLVHREFPAWNPYACGGYPLHANPQTPFLSPLAWPALALGSVVGLKVFALLHVLIGLAGAFVLARRLGMRGPAAYLLAVAFGCGARVAWVMQGGQFAMLTYGFLPWLLVFSLRAEDDLSQAVGTGATLAWMVLEGGTSGVPIGVFLIAAFAVAAAVAHRSPRPLMGLLIALAVGFALSLPKTWPMLAYLEDHPRTLSGADDALGAGPVARMFFARRAVPFLMDAAREQALSGLHYRWWGEYGAYVGPILPALAAVGLVYRGRDAALWVALGLLFFAIMLGRHGAASPFELLGRLPIYQDLRVPSRWSILVVLCVAILAAHGLDEMRRRAREARRLRWLPWALCAAVAVDQTAFANQVLSSIAKRAPEAEEVRHKPLEPAASGAGDLATAVRRGLATLDCYDPLFEATGYRSPVHDRLARMRSAIEARGAARAILIDWTPNRIEFLLTAPQPAVVQIRQNHDRSWVADTGEVFSDHGVLAVRVPAGTHVVTVRCVPVGVATAALLSSLVAAGLATAWLLRRRGRRGGIARPGPTA